MLQSRLVALSSPSAAPVSHSVCFLSTQVILEKYYTRHNSCCYSFMTALSGLVTYCGHMAPVQLSTGPVKYCVLRHVTHEPPPLSQNMFSDENSQVL